MRYENFWQWFDDEAAPKLAARAKTFRAMFEHLDTIADVVHIVETGCIEESDNWAGNGCSTLLFDRYASLHRGSTVRSVDIVQEKVDTARKLVSPATEVRCGDSVEVMREFARDSGRKVHLLYLDSCHHYWENPFPSARHILEELITAMPMLTQNSLVVVDDTVSVMDEFPRFEVAGKGELVAKYATSVGADLQFSEYQTGWTNMTGTPDVSPHTIKSLVLRAREHVESHRSSAADQLYHQILVLTSLTRQPWDPTTRVVRGEACVFFARMALARGKMGTACDWFLEALRADPRAAEYRQEIATKCYLNMGRGDLAVQEIKRGLELEPENVKLWLALGGVQHELNEPEKSIAAFDKALELAPNDPQALLERTTIALDVEDYETVRKNCHKVRGTDKWSDALHILAMAEYREDRHEESIELFDAALAAGARDPAIVQWHKSHSLESIGRYREANIARAHRADSKQRPAIVLPFKRFQAPLWVDQPAPATIHVHAESGAGDNICLVRYLPMLVERGYKVNYESHEGMTDLVARSMPTVDVMRRALDFPGALGLKVFDYHLPIGEIMRAFDTDIDTVPWNGPYLHAPPSKVRHYRGILPAGKKVGLCWSSGIRTYETWLKRYGLRKSMHFDILLPVLKAVHKTGWNGINVQVGPEREQHEGRLIEVLPDKPDWDDTAALIANLDLVITVDTAVAHLAGAMGKPVWLMMHPGGSWHFMVARPGSPWNEASPWYPSIRIFRQDRPGDWAGVIHRVTKELKAFKDEGPVGLPLTRAAV